MEFLVIGAILTIFGCAVFALGYGSTQFKEKKVEYHAWREGHKQGYQQGVIQSPDLEDEDRS